MEIIIFVNFAIIEKTLLEARRFKKKFGTFVVQTFVVQTLYTIWLPKFFFKERASYHFKALEFRYLRAFEFKKRRQSIFYRYKVTLFLTALTFR